MWLRISFNLIILLSFLLNWNIFFLILVFSGIIFWDKFYEGFFWIILFERIVSIPKEIFWNFQFIYTALFLLSFILIYKFKQSFLNV